MQALRTAASGMAAQQLNVEVISNNIANMNTVGFKKQRAEFQDLLYQNVERIVTDDGDALQPAVTIPQDATDVTISKSGLVQVTQAGQTAPTTVGQIELATFFNEAGLEAIGDNLLLETAASGAANIGTPGSPGFGKILQGYTEASNVDSVAEISALIIAQRAYEMNSKVISTADNMLSVTAQVKS